MRQKDLLTIADTVPFSLLPRETMEALGRDFSVTEHKKGTLLFVQGKSKVEHLYLVARGAVERYFEDDRGKILRARLGEGEVYGGISILMNEGVSVRTLTVAEDSTFYTLPAGKFRELCAEGDAFREYFTSTFGKLMENRSYAGMIAMQKNESSLSFFNRPVSAIFKPNLVSCSAGDSIQAAAVKMTKNSISAIFIRNNENRIQGIVTDSDLRRRVIARGHDISSPVSEIMSDSLVSVDADAQVFEAYLLLMQNSLNHLPVRNRSGRITGVLTDNDFMAAQGKSPYLLIKEIKTATRFEQLEKIHDRLPGMLLDPIKNGSNTENLTKFITAFSDAILDKIIRFAIESKGQPPCRFAFMVMGSEGREEQTLKTDQDNAIVYEDPADEALQKKAEAYFKELAHMICTWLDRAGFEFCQGNNMAMNPDWCQPLSVWKSYFSKWIHAADPEDLLNSSIFFDFKGAWGDTALTDQLSEFLVKSLKGWSGFFRHLTENALYFKPPIGFFRNFVVHSKGEHKDAFDLKMAMHPITDCARIYALKNGVRETNTLARLFRLYTKNILTNEEYNDISQSYRYLMNLRILKQVTAIVDEGKKPDNYINPDNLSRVDQTMLKEIFKRIENFQQKADVDFTGV